MNPGHGDSCQAGQRGEPTADADRFAGTPPGSRRRTPGPTALLALYPRAWRRRYGDELDALILDMHADGRAIGWRVRADQLRSAARERVRGQGGTPGRRIQSGASLVLWGWALFVLAGAIVAKTSEHWEQALSAPTPPGAAVAFSGLTALAIGTTALVAGGIALTVPAAAQFVREGGWPTIRARAISAAAMTLLAMAATVALVRWAHSLDVADRNGHDARYAAAFLGWAAVGAACLLAWTALGTRIAREIRCRRVVLRAQALLVPLVAIAMAAMTLATVAWWALVGHAHPGALTGGSPVGQPSAFVPQLAVAVVVMLIATGVAALGAARAGLALGDLGR